MALKPVTGEQLPTCRIELPKSDDGAGGTRQITTGYIFNQDKQIGEGTYGQVFQGFEKNDHGNKVALKKIRMDTEREGFPITAIREIKILQRLQHENVVNLREIVRSEIHKNNNYRGSIYMVFDYADYDLTGLMEAAKYSFSEPQVKCIMKQLLKGLFYCHSNGVLHRDLKASNILIDNSGTVKLADFGLARPFQDKQDGRFTNRVITLWYRPPELLLNADKYGPEIDMWSVGCIFAELLCGKPIFPGKDEPDQLDKVFQLLGTPTEYTWPGVSELEYFKNVPPNKYTRNKLKDWVKGHRRTISESAISLLQRFLTLDPTKRISALDALDDKYFWEDPMPCEPSDLPCKGSSHEYTMKKRRNEMKERERAAEAAATNVGGGGGAWQHGDQKRQRTGPTQGNQPRGGWNGPSQSTYSKYGGQQGAGGQGAGYAPSGSNRPYNVTAPRNAPANLPPLQHGAGLGPGPTGYAQPSRGAAPGGGHGYGSTAYSGAGPGPSGASMGPPAFGYSGPQHSRGGPHPPGPGPSVPPPMYGQQWSSGGLGPGPPGQSRQHTGQKR